ncbi:mast cell-expressed membrane protein 1 [Elephas maximus indicus]|uniref:mast cell-expressed membrane protein 1 n=1 Tax=Elephas maximus indicus TaxID=99487 RepID=UPI002116DD4A|nr:mast cell-expressed membrane protein 1 [Elephas maximus indicus]
MSWQAGDHGVEEIYPNQEVKMQAAASKDKKQGGPARNQGEGDPNYENITLTFRSQVQPKCDHSPPKSQVPAQSRLPSDPAQTPRWLYRAIMSLYILLALTFIFFIILSAMILVKNSELSQEFLVLKMELWNVSNSLYEIQEEQNKRQSLVREAIHQMIKEAIHMINTSGNGNLETLKKEVKQVKMDLVKKMDTILKELEKKQNPSAPAQSTSK